MGPSEILLAKVLSNLPIKKAFESTLKEVADLTHETDTSFYISYVDENLKKAPEKCCGKGYKNPKKKANLIMGISGRVGEAWISFYTKKELSESFSRNGFDLIKDVVLKDLNPMYFEPKDRGLKEKEIFNLEHSAVAYHRKAK